jgi:hypothetical protein
MLLLIYTQHEIHIVTILVSIDGICVGDSIYCHLGRAVAQAVSRWLPTAVARVRVRVACGVCGGQSGTGAGFLRVFRFPLPIIPLIFPSS